MASNTNRRGGILFVKIDGVQYDAKGNWSYSLGTPEREVIKGPDKVHGYKELPGEPMIEGEITDRSDLDLKKLCNITNSTLTLELANNKTIVLRNAWCDGKVTVQTDEGNIKVKFNGLEAEEIS